MEFKLIEVSNRETGKTFNIKVITTENTILDGQDMLCDHARIKIVELCIDICKDITVKNIISFQYDNEDDGHVLFYNPKL